MRGALGLLAGVSFPVACPAHGDAVRMSGKAQPSAATERGSAASDALCVGPSRSRACPRRGSSVARTGLFVLPSSCENHGSLTVSNTLWYKCGKCPKPFISKEKGLVLCI